MITATRGRSFLLAVTMLLWIVWTAGCGSKSPPPLRITKSSDPYSLSAIRKEIAAGRLDEAWTKLQQQMIERPEDDEVRSLAAEVLSQQKQFTEAAELLESKPAKSSRDNYRFLGQAADWYRLARQWRTAEERYRRLLEETPQNAVPRLRLAQLYYETGKDGPAEKILRDTLSFSPIDPQSLFRLAGPSIAITPPAATSNDAAKDADWLPYARQLDAEGKTSEAVQLTRAILQQAPDSTAAAAFLGRLLAELQQPDSFLEWLRHLPQGVDQESDYWTALGMWHQLNDEPGAAVRCYAESLELRPDQLQVMMRYSQCLQAVGADEITRKAQNRARLLDDLFRLATRMEEPNFDRDARPRIIAILEQLDRQVEARAWQATITGPPPSMDLAPSASSHAQPTEISSKLSQVTLCGLVKGDWPLPNLDHLATSQPIRAATSLRDAVNTRFELADVAKETGLEFQYESGFRVDGKEFYLYQVNGAGIAAIDFDADGWMDLYFAQGGGDPRITESSGGNALFRNQAGMSFRDVTSFSGAADRGFGQGVAAGDFNQDGFIDLFVGNLGESRLWLNQGDGRFARCDTLDLPPFDWTSSVAIADLDGDHLPDLLQVNYLDDVKVYDTPCKHTNSVCRPQNFREARNRFWRSRGEGTIEPLTNFTPEEPLPSIGFSPVITDIDQRGGNDIFIANDGRPNQLWLAEWNQPAQEGSGVRRLIECAKASGCATGTKGEELAGMGIATGDFDRNGLVDFHVTNFYDQPVSLYLQMSPGFFVNQTRRYGLYDPSMAVLGFGTQAADFNADGWLDLMVLNGHIYDARAYGQPFQMLPQLFHGSGSAFTLASKDSLGSYGLRPTLGRTLALLDWNRDGRVDAVANHLDVPVALLENRTPSGHWMAIECIGVQSERDGIGARIELRAGDEHWTGWITAGDGLMCTNEPAAHFGLGPVDKIDSIQIVWPSGKTQMLKNLAADRRYVVIENRDEAIERTP